MLWLAFLFILLSASLILALTLGPLKRVPNVRAIRNIAYVQYAAAALLALARLTGKA